MDSKGSSAAPSAAEVGTANEKHFVLHVTANDVLVGRGAPAIMNEGNIRFRKIVQSRKDEYTSTSKRQRKDWIARQVIRAVELNKGSFLRKIENPDEAESLGVPAGKEAWTYVSDEEILQKVKQALRDNPSDETDDSDAKKSRKRKQVSEISATSAEANEGAGSAKAARNQHDDTRRTPIESNTFDQSQPSASLLDRGLSGRLSALPNTNVQSEYSQQLKDSGPYFLSSRQQQGSLSFRTVPPSFETANLLSRQGLHQPIFPGLNLGPGSRTIGTFFSADHPSGLYSDAASQPLAPSMISGDSILGTINPFANANRLYGGGLPNSLVVNQERGLYERQIQAWNPIPSFQNMASQAFALRRHASGQFPSSTERNAPAGKRHGLSGESVSNDRKLPPGHLQHTSIDAGVFVSPSPPQDLTSVWSSNNEFLQSPGLAEQAPKLSNEIEFTWRAFGNLIQHISRDRLEKRRLRMSAYSQSSVFRNQSSPDSDDLQGDLRVVMLTSTLASDSHGLAKKVVMLLGKLLGFAFRIDNVNAGEEKSRSNVSKSLLMEVRPWLESQLRLWSAFFGVSDATSGQPLPFADSDFVATHPQFVGDEAVRLRAVMDRDSCLAFLAHVALLTRLRSIVQYSSSSLEDLSAASSTTSASTTAQTISSKIERARQDFSAAAVRRDGPAWWGIQGDCLDLDVMLLERVLKYGFLGFLDAADERQAGGSTRNKKMITQIQTLRKLGMTCKRAEERFFALVSCLHRYQETVDQNLILLAREHQYRQLMART